MRNADPPCRVEDLDPDATEVGRRWISETPPHMSEGCGRVASPEDEAETISYFESAATFLVNRG